MRSTELDARDKFRDENGKLRILKREDTGLYGSGIDTSQNVYKWMTNNGDIWSPIWIRIESKFQTWMLGMERLGF